jgi:hypothetical protein
MMTLAGSRPKCLAGGGPLERRVRPHSCGVRSLPEAMTYVKACKSEADLLARLEVGRWFGMLERSLFDERMYVTRQHGTKLVVVALSQDFIGAATFA